MARKPKPCLRTVKLQRVVSSFKARKPRKAKAKK